MPPGRDAIEVTVNGLTISGIVAPVPDARALIVALHGGGFTSRYFDVPGSEEGSLIDLANRAGYAVVCFDRPGHGASSQIPAADNSYERQAEVLGASAAAAADRLGLRSVFLIGHSIGGMIVVTIAAREHSVPLVGISVTGMGAVIPPGGASEGLRSIATGGPLELPADQTDSMMFGPPGTFRAAAVEGAHRAYAPALSEELVAAPGWAAQHLPSLAPTVTVPVQNVLAEFDSLWDSGPEAIARFASLFTAAPFVECAVARRTGHAIDHHLLGAALHHRQLAFAAECVHRQHEIQA